MRNKNRSLRICFRLLTKKKVNSLFLTQKLYSGKVKLPKGGKKWYNIDIEMSDKNDDQKENIGKFNMIFSTLEELVPQDHKIRAYDQAVDWKFIYPLVEHLYSTTGKPSIDPIVLFKMIFLNYIEGIHSIRKTCERCQTDIAYRWFWRINLDEKVPDHSTFSQNLRRKFLETNLFKEIFTHIVKEAYEFGFIDPENIFGDSTHVKASANKKKHQDKIVQYTENLYYEDLKKDINKDRLSHGKKEIDFEDDDEDTPNKNNTLECDDELTKESNEDELIEIISEEEKKKLVTYNQETEEIKELDSRIKYKHIKESTVDKDAGYRTPGVAKTILDDGKKILVPYKRPMTKKGFFKKHEYVYDEYYDAYICPNNEFLRYTTTNKTGYREYKSNPKVCEKCPYINQCTTSKNHTKIVTQHVWNEYLETCADIRYEIGTKEIYSKRKETIERCFADGKENFGLRFTRYRGIKRVTQSHLLIFACMNFKKFALWKAKYA